MTATIALGPAPIDITGIRAGDVNALSVYLHIADAPLDLTPYVVTAQARASAASDQTLDATVEIEDQQSGRFILRWDGDDVRTLLGSRASWAGIWDLQIAAGPSVLTVAAGKFTIEMDVTR